LPASISDPGIDASRGVIEHLVHKQNPLDPYFTLWSRLDGFATDELSAMVLDRRAVRIGLLRTTPA
jgi:hypothetical protein